MTDRSEAVTEALNTYFKYVAPSVPKEDRKDIGQIAQYFVCKYPYQSGHVSRGKRQAQIKTYIEEMIRNAHRKFYVAKSVQTRSLLGWQESALYDVSAGDPVGDQHLGWYGAGRVIDLYGHSDLVHTPPYKVVFSTRVDLDAYRRDPYFVPGFSIYPTDDEIVGVRIREDMLNRAARYDDISQAEMQSLNEHRSAFQKSVRTLVPDYLYEYGFQSIKPELRKMVASFNKDGVPLERLHVAVGTDQRTLARRWAMLESRGWIRTFNEKKGREVLRYHPAYDGKRSLHLTRFLKSLEERPVVDMLMYLTFDIDKMVYDNTLTDEELRKEVLASRSRMIEHSADYDAEEKYDLALKAFITSLIERPLFTKGMSLSAVDRFVGSLPVERQKAIIYRAIRERKNIQEVFGFADYFGEVCYETANRVDLRVLLA